MSEWWTYRIGDLLLFSPRVYDRLFELHNRALWPAQLLALVLGAALLWLLARRRPLAARTVPAALGALWLWVAWVFLWQRYLPINWAIAYAVPAFVLQGLGLLALAATPRGLAPALRGKLRQGIGCGLVAAAIFGYPLLAPLLGKPWTAAQVFGLAPDPTVVATLGALALAQGRLRWVLLAVPCAWCAVTGATLWTLDSWEFLVAPAAALLAVGSGLQGMAVRGSQRQHDQCRAGHG